MTALSHEPPATVPAAARAPSVVLVEDHVALRKGIELLLRSEGLSVIGVADDVDYAYELVSRRRPDVVLVDIGLRGRSGLDLARRLLDEDPDAGVLLYSGSVDRDVLADALSTGVRGFALKNGTPRELTISSETVRTHVRNAMRKLAAKTRVHAVTLALKRHEISLH